MIRHKLKVLVFIFFCSRLLYGQEFGADLNYQMLMISNPALTGSEGDGKLRMSYLNNYPGNSYNLNFICLSYDGYFPGLHGGAGFFISDNCLGGVLNDLQGGFSYSYYLQAGEDIFISGGLSASFYHRGYNTGSVILPDQIDPLSGVIYPAGEVLPVKGRTKVDISTGFLIMTGRSFGGVAVSHLTEPDLSNTGDVEMKMRRKLFLHFCTEVDLGPGKTLVLQPLTGIEISGNRLSAALATGFRVKYLTISSIFLSDNNKNLDLQPGFSFTLGGITIYYDYRFNLISGSNLFPFSLQHRTGIALSLNNVDKRKTIKTINFPKL